MKNVTVYSADWCPYCDAAKRLLGQRGIPFEEINVDRIPGFRQKLVEMTGQRTVPQIIIDEQPVGGFTELAALDRSGRLAELVGS